MNSRFVELIARRISPKSFAAPAAGLAGLPASPRLNSGENGRTRDYRVKAEGGVRSVLGVLCRVAAILIALPAFGQIPVPDCLPQVIHYWSNGHQHEEIWNWVGDHYHDADWKDGSEIYVVKFSRESVEFHRRNATGTVDVKYTGKVAPVGVIDRVGQGEGSGVVSGYTTHGSFVAEWYRQQTVGSCESEPRPKSVVMPPIIRVTMGHNDGIFRWYNNHYQAVWPNLDGVTGNISVNAFSSDFVELDRLDPPKTRTAGKQAVYVGKLTTSGDQISVAGGVKNTAQGPVVGYWHGSWPMYPPWPGLGKTTQSINKASGIWEGDVHLPDNSSYKIRIDLQDGSADSLSGREIVTAADRSFRAVTKVSGSVAENRTSLTLKETPLPSQDQDYWCTSDKNEFIANRPDELVGRPSDNRFGDDPCARTVVNLLRDPQKSKDWDICLSSQRTMELNVLRRLQTLEELLKKSLKEQFQIVWKPKLSYMRNIFLSEQPLAQDGSFTCDTEVAVENDFTWVDPEAHEGQTIGDLIKAEVYSLILNQYFRVTGNLILGNTDDGLRHLPQPFSFRHSEKGGYDFVPLATGIYAGFSDTDRR